MRHSRILPGRPAPLGASWDGSGVNFALFSEHATSVELLLFASESASAPDETITLTHRTHFIWHCSVEGVLPGQCYGYRVHGPYDPAHGHRFNAHKVLLDPYARAISGDVVWQDSIFGFDRNAHSADLSFSTLDSAGKTPYSVVVDPSFDWEDDAPPRIALEETVIYETHVKGISAVHPEVPAPLRGTYAGLASRPILDHFRTLGVTAVQLLPVHHHCLDRSLADRGLTNYWGYNTIGFFAPDSRFSHSGRQGGQVTEFREMVKALHREGLEVILDVVFNHTAEGDHLGPTLCFRGIDNASYYQLRPEKPRYYVDHTGCGCSLRSSHPMVLRLIMDSLRYWVQQMHVDGFRFDLAVTLARPNLEYDRHAAFLSMVSQDPVLAEVKLIAEPWDLGPDGFRLGWFGDRWSELNARYRDTTRRYWKGLDGQCADMAYRLAGSSDQFRLSGRSPLASVNFITAHDGFTLSDLVSYEHKHNQANKEHNRDGSDMNDSWNCGQEGPSRRESVLALRRRQTRNFLTTLLFSQGVPMLLGGDELGQTQHGNNNAYCQDNEISWYNWNLSPEQHELVRITSTLIRIRLAHPALRRRTFLDGTIGPAGLKDVNWIRPDGTELRDSDWHDTTRKTIGMLLAGDGGGICDADGGPVHDKTLFLLLNSDTGMVQYGMPFALKIREVLVDTARGIFCESSSAKVLSPLRFELEAQSAALLVLDTHQLRDTQGVL